MAEIEVTWTLCRECGERIIDHTTMTGATLVCPEPRLADVVPLAADTEGGDK